MSDRAAQLAEDLGSLSLSLQKSSSQPQVSFDTKPDVG
jgi:hypothetical protein